MNDKEGVIRLQIFYQNVRGLRTKIHELNNEILGNAYDIIILTETWLHRRIFLGELFDERYNDYRCDRNYVHFDMEHGKKGL